VLFNALVERRDELPVLRSVDQVGVEQDSIERSPWELGH
jgi:hypothetical protein